MDGLLYLIEQRRYWVCGHLLTVQNISGQYTRFVLSVICMYTVQCEAKKLAPKTFCDIFTCGKLV